MNSYLIAEKTRRLFSILAIIVSLVGLIVTYFLSLVQPDPSGINLEIVVVLMLLFSCLATGIYLTIKENNEAKIGYCLNCRCYYNVKRSLQENTLICKDFCICKECAIKVNEGL